MSYADQMETYQQDTDPTRRVRHHFAQTEDGLDLATIAIGRALEVGALTPVDAEEFRSDIQLLRSKLNEVEGMLGRPE